MTRFDPERRRLLVLAGGLLATAFAGPYALSALADRLGGHPALADALRSLVTRHESAVRLGRDYLALHPDEAASGRLARHIVGARGSAERDIRSLVLAQIHDDFAEHRMVRLDGWILSRTEGRLYALVALS